MANAAPFTAFLTRFAFLAWIPIIASFLLTLAGFPFLFSQGLVCLSHPLSFPLFLAYLGLTAFPAAIFLIKGFLNKRFSIEFETQRKETLVSFWIWLVLMLWAWITILQLHMVPLPAWNPFLVCS